MGVCCSTHTTDVPPSEATRELRSQEQSLTAMSQGVGAYISSSQQGGTRSLGPQVEEVPLRELSTHNRANSLPQNVQCMRASEYRQTRPSHMHKAKPSDPLSRSPSSRMSAEHSRASPRRPAMSYPPRRPLNSTVRQVLSENFKFRILVVGKSGSGKSSLIKAIFKVDVTAEPRRTLGKADINVEFRPEDNRYLIVHECSGLGSQASDSQDLQTIRGFILHRTDANRLPSERLHAIWICVPASDAIDGRLGDGIEEILGMRNVPVVLVFTKFDVAVSRVLFDIAGRDPRRYERARSSAHTMYEESCRRILHKDPRDVPAEIVSENPRFIDLVDNLVVTTDRFILRAPSTQAGVQGERQRIGDVPLAWSAALRINHDIIIRASIEVGRCGYWRSRCPDFANRKLKNCVDIIHVDIVEIWNLNDKLRYLSSDRFKVKMSHLVKDLAGSANATSGTGDNYADWVHDVYRGSRENVSYVMGYIVDLTVILYGIFWMAAGDVSPNHVEEVFERHVRSGHRDAIHHDIRTFIPEAFAIQSSSFVPTKDLVLERIIDLIKQFCVPPGND